MPTFSDGGAAMSDMSPHTFPSAGDMRLHLQNLLDLKERQLQQAGTLGQRVLAQQIELEERIRQLQEMEADKTENDDPDSDMREKYRDLAATVKSWDDENAQLSSTFGGQRLVNGNRPSPPFQPTELAPEETDVSREEPERLAASAGQSAAQSRRARNAAHRQDDVEFAFEIGSGLLVEVRRLQSLLGERDKAIQDMKEEKDDLEKTVENLRTALRSQEQSADKFKEENWNLEVTLQELRVQQTETQTDVQRLEGEHKRLTKQLNVSREAADQHKNEAERQKTAFDELKAKHETDVAQARRNAASLQRDKGDLQQTIDSLKAEAARAGKRLPRFGSPLTPNGVDKSQLLTPNIEKDDDVFGNTGGASTTNRKRIDNSGLFSDGFGSADSSPDPSPSRPFLSPNHPLNEIEALQQRLGHAQRQINTLKGTLQREKELRMEYRRKLESSGTAVLDDDEEPAEDANGEDASAPSKPLRSTPFRSSRGRGRGRGRGGLTLAQRLGLAAQNPSSDYEDIDDFEDPPSPPPVPPIPSKFQTGELGDEGSDDEGHYGSQEQQSPSPSTRLSVDGLDPNFANVIRRSVSASSLPLSSSPLRQSVAARGRGGSMARRARGGAAYQEVRPPSLVGQPEALAAELGLGTASESDLQPTKVETAEFGVQTDDLQEPVPVSEPVVPAPPIVVTPVKAEAAVQVDPEPVVEQLAVEQRQMSTQTDLAPVVQHSEAGTQPEAAFLSVGTSVRDPEASPSPPMMVQAEVQTPPVETADVHTQTPPPSSPPLVEKMEADMQTEPSMLLSDEFGQNTFFRDDRRSTITQADISKYSLDDSSGNSTIRAHPLSAVLPVPVQDGATTDMRDAETDAETDAESYHDARQSNTTSPTQSANDNDFQSIYTVTDNDFPETDDDQDVESIKASRMPSRQGRSTSSISQHVPPPIVLYESKGVSAEAPEPPKPEVRDSSMQTDEWVPPAPVLPPVLPGPAQDVAPATNTPSALQSSFATPLVSRVGPASPQQFHFISPPPSAGPTATSIPVSPSPVSNGILRDFNIPRPRTSQSDRRRSIESTLSSVLDDTPGRSRAPSAAGSPIVDKSRPPMMVLPPPPRLPPPPNSMPPPSFIPERRLPSTPGASHDVPPPRPTSPPPPELIQRATTPTFGSALAVPGRGVYAPRQHGSSLPPLQQGLGQPPSTNSFRSAANAAAHSQHTVPSPSAVATFGRREQSTTSLLSDRSMGSQRSSISSDHYLDRSQGPPNTSITPGRAGAAAADTSARSAGAASTDPSVIHAITQTMIGEFLYKYTRRALGKGYGERRHRRFFWVHPYTKTLYWSSADPGSSNVSESSAKSAYIEGVKSVLDPNPMPPGLYQYSVVVSTPNREMKITAPTKERHDMWLNALKYLLSRPSAMMAASPGNMPAAPLSPMSVHTSLPDAEHQNPIMSSPRSYRSARSGRTEVSGDSWNHTPRGRRSQSQLSARGSIGKRAGTPAAEYLRWGGPSEDPQSPSKSYEHIPMRNEEELDFELHDDTMSDEGFEGLENVRACCDGRHTVGRGTKDHHHHHHHNHHHPPRDSSRTSNHHHLDVNPSEVTRPVSPAWSFRSRASSVSTDHKGLFGWGKEDGKLRFGSRRSTKTVPVVPNAQDQ